MSYKVGDVIVIVRAKSGIGDSKRAGECVQLSRSDLEAEHQWAYEVRLAEPHEEAVWRLREKQ